MDQSRVGESMFTPVQWITCDNIEACIWERYRYWENESLVYQQLKDKYRLQHVDHPERASFQNTQSLISYVRQARAFLGRSRPIDRWVDPLCFYYGMMSLLKALILTVDIDYPSHTAILRHGLSTRKRKKSQYQFLQDEIKIQKEGLLPHLLHRLNASIPVGTTYRPIELIGMIPELQSDYRYITGNRTLFPVRIHSSPTCQKNAGMLISLEQQILDDFHRPIWRLTEYLNQAQSESRFEIESTPSSNRLFLRWYHPSVNHVLNWEYGFRHPYFFENSKGDYFLWLGNNHPTTQPIPEWTVHYLLLFLMSMLCRYDAPLWDELHYSTKEAVLIQPLLQVVKRKFPHLILQILNGEKIYLRIG